MKLEDMDTGDLLELKGQVEVEISRRFGASARSPDVGLKQSLYDHGGSRIYTEINGRRDLYCDTYHTRDFALAVRRFTEEWISRENSPVSSTRPDQKP